MRKPKEMEKEKDLDLEIDSSILPQCLVLTGPNMGGKTSYCKQV
jgi:DNA mismatch repair ATPase MutS